MVHIIDIVITGRVRGEVSGDNQRTSGDPIEVTPEVRHKKGTQVFVYEKNGEIVLRPITDEYIEGMAGMMGTKGKLLRALKEEKAKEQIARPGVFRA